MRVIYYGVIDSKVYVNDAVFAMKKILLYLFSMVFVLAFGVAYAAEGNGVTDFRGLTYDIGPTPAIIPVAKGAHGGGMREEGPAKVFYNGVTDFGKVESAKNEPESGMQIEGSAKVFYNGVTDFGSK